MRLCTEFAKPHPPTGQALIRPRAVHTPQSKPGSSRATSRPDIWRAQCQLGPAVLEPMQNSEAAQHSASENISRQDSGLHCSTSERDVGSSEDVLRSISEVLQRAGGAKYYQEAGFLSNAVERRGPLQEVDKTASAEAEEEEAGSEPITRGRRRRVGRPIGLPSWNKGVSMSEATKRKISSAQKQRWQDPALRASVSEKQKGRVPWNKGKPVSKETRERMSRARRFTVYPDALCAKLGRSHRGLTHSPETCALLSQKLSGKAKSAEHRAAIAAGQRKRFAASRLLNAARAFAPQEECDSEAHSSSSAPEVPSIPDTEVLYSSGSPAKRKAVATKSKLPDNSAVVEDFVGQLRRFRALQEELEPWTSAFRAEHGRKPRIEDVQHTTNEWLVSKFKDYMSLRGRLLNESQLLRNKIEGSGPRNGKNILGGTLYREKLNANEPATGSVSQGAARIASALKYCRSQSASHPAPSSPADVVAPDQQQQALPGTQQINGHLEESSEGKECAAESIAEIEVPISGSIFEGVSATAAHSSTDGCDGNGFLDPSHESTNDDAALDKASNGTASVAPAVREKGARVVSPSLVAGASPRVRSAMLAAMDYRKKQARQSKPDV